MGSPTDDSARLVAFDVDGTLVGSRDGRVVWQFLNTHFGGDAQINRNRFQSYLDGRISYRRWVDLDVGDWVAVGARRDEIAAVILEHLYLLPGARECVWTLRERGFQLAVISGTIDLTLELLFPRHPFDEVFTNRIWFNDEGLIAGWEATPYDMEGKAEALRAIAGRRQVPLAETLYVGDNINDIQVMQAAGRAIAFEPKDPTVSAAADHTVHGDLRRVLELV